MDMRTAIRVARREQHLSQRRLAEAAGVPQSTVGRLETGALRPRSDTLERLADALDHEFVLRGHLGTGVDRTLIQATLALSPRERLLRSASTGEAISRLRQGTSTAR
jgi:transcriptional regulator with XRE-family HTH domain